MKVWQVHYSEVSDGSKGFDYFGTLREARIARFEAKQNKLETTLRKIVVPFSKAGVLRALNIYGGHPDNG